MTTYKSSRYSSRPHFPSTTTVMIALSLLFNKTYPALFPVTRTPAACKSSGIVARCAAPRCRHRASSMTRVRCANASETSTHCDLAWFVYIFSSDIPGIYMCATSAFRCSRLFAVCGKRDCIHVMSAGKQYERGVQFGLNARICRHCASGGGVLREVTGFRD